MEVPTWVKSRYGDVQIHEDERAPFKVVDFIEETNGEQNLGVYVSDAQGDPVQNVAVVMYWPDAPLLESEAGWLERGNLGFTNESGYVGFPMGGGSYYFPKAGQHGPQHVWLHGDGMSEMVSGLGMLGQTPYHHVDVHFCMQPIQPPQPQPPEPPTPPPEEPTWAKKIIVLLKEILVELRRLSNG